MAERRVEQRLLCAELVTVTWREQGGGIRSEIMNLEDICESGLCLQAELPVRKGQSVQIHYQPIDGLGTDSLRGTVRYCIYGELGYILGVEFVEGCKWPAHRFQPKHLFDPRSLKRQKEDEIKLLTAPLPGCAPLKSY